MKCKKNVQQNIISMFDQHKTLHDNIIILFYDKCKSGCYMDKNHFITWSII